MTQVFVDGREGTTGLQIVERLQHRQGIELIEIDADKRKDPAARRECLNSADIAFLCLPDAAAIEAVALCDNPHTRLIDASTAHRTAPGWVYGFPELIEGQYARIAAANRVAVPGCYASGFNALIYPLRKAGLLDSDVQIYCHALSGYTGAGKKAIAQYESDARPAALDAPRFYALGLAHKHLKEMCAISKLSTTPIFQPIICDFPQGMLVSIPLYSADLNHASLSLIHEVYQRHYGHARFIDVMPLEYTESGFIDAQALANTNQLQIILNGNSTQFSLLARLDNLGKGASGAALQCMNIMLNEPEETALGAVTFSFSEEKVTKKKTLL